MRAANELRVGIVVVAALVMLASGYFYLRGLGFGADVYYMRLAGPANVQVGNDVRLQGVRVGQVQEVNLDPATQRPVLTLVVRRHNPVYPLLRTYAYSVQSSAILGDSYVDIRGKFTPGAPAYQPNDPNQIITGGTAPGLAGISDAATDLIRDFQVTLAKFNVTIDRVNKGVLSYQNQMKLARALDDVSRTTRAVGQTFGAQGMKLQFGDPRARESFNSTLANASVAAQEAGLAAHNLRLFTRDLGGLVGENRAQIHEVLAGLSRTTQNVAGVAETLNFLMKQGGFKENAQGAFAALRRAAENVEATTANFKAVSTPQTQADLRNAITALRQTTESFRDTAASVKSLVADPTTQTELKTTLSTLRQTTESLRDTAQSVKGLVSDPAVQEQLKGTLASLNATAATLQQATVNLRDTAAGVKNLVADPQVQSDLKGSVSELRATLAASRAAAERINTLLGGHRPSSPASAPPAPGTAPGTAPAATAPASKTLVPAAGARQGIDFTYRHLFDVEGGPRTGRDVTGRNYGDLNFNTELFGGPFRLGVDNVGEGTDLTAQTGTYMSRNADARYGLYRSKLGAGLDVWKGPLSLEGNLWDPNQRSYNAYVGLRLSPKVQILAGRENIRGVRTNTVGVRLTP